MKEFSLSVKWSMAVWVLLCCYSCFDNRSENDDKSLDTEISSDLGDDTMDVTLWEYDPEADSLFLDQKSGDLSTEKVISALNERYAELVKLDLIRANADTVFVQILEPSYLTQRMGTTGAYGYMAEVTYSLTEIPGIHFVNFDFQEGEHAGPGLYQRSDFLNKL